ncbi:MAG: carboxylating nicotinate-nucleotide diphosphorylase [Candidatus Eremiobacteraeota bacterium]|nr:carboxylating nicotinate-nucleotide diphosphorylase [Candidatus Eremiobacteraeota bacterium]MBC5803774.1 carboxylating nicotinate-nucleotide diphosphorylase [Candidatus Eremiobacteraeota bacterium]MBC5822813.1 carboxylating nicotinate-nucleotide diphosphorylase [Candidatus Eremiobacteraeota bacterium]
MVRAALAEDLGLGGDITAQATVPADARARGALVARAGGVLAGLEVALAAFRLLDAQIAVDVHYRDGGRVERGDTIATLEGDARALLGAERTALNVLSHLCGVATTTACYVAAVSDTPCAITETRKTLPGLRALQKYAVRAGGGANHRFRLDDAMLIKDNHIALAGGIEAALRAVRARAGRLVRIEIEVDDLQQLDAVLESPNRLDAVLLDNFSLADTREAVGRIGGRLTVEASGGMTLDNVAEVARAGVDVISVGALTHSVTALDIGLDVTLTANSAP